MRREQNIGGARGAVRRELNIGGARAAGHAARALAAASYCLWWFVCGVLSCVEIKIFTARSSQDGRVIAEK